MFDITAIGELLIDFTPTGNSSTGDLLFARKAGGAPANVLAANSKLGGKNAFIGKVGRDMFGSFLKQELDNYGINTDGLVVDSDIPTTLAFVQFDQHGDRSFSFYRKPGADIMLRIPEINEDTIRKSHFFHFGSVSLTNDPSRTTTFHAVDTAKKAGCIISYDPNFRPPLWGSTEDAKEQITAGLQYADIVKVSEEEMTLITNETDLLAGAHKLAQYGVSLVLVSLGPKGAFYFTNDQNGLVPTYDVKTIDTNGAGDSFFAAVLYRLSGMNLNQIQHLDKANLDDISLFANAAGSLTTTRAGAMPAMPTIDEIRYCQKHISLLK